MKKLFVLALIATAFVSCKKEKAVELPDNLQPVYIRIESVNTDSEAIYSPVVLVR